MIGTSLQIFVGMTGEVVAFGRLIKLSRPWGRVGWYRSLVGPGEVAFAGPVSFP